MGIADPSGGTKFLLNAGKFVGRHRVLDVTRQAPQPLDAGIKIIERALLIDVGPSCNALGWGLTVIDDTHPLPAQMSC